MAQAMVNFRMDAELKNNLDAVCKEMGLTTTSAFTIFANKVVRERRIPFEINADPFYSKENIDFLREAVRELNSGKGVEHNLIED